MILFSGECYIENSPVGKFSAIKYNYIHPLCNKTYCEISNHLFITDATIRVLEMAILLGSNSEIIYLTLIGFYTSVRNTDE
jgi:hypothetical protein